MRFVLSGALSRLESSFQLSLQLLDTVKGQPLGRSVRIAPDLEVLRAQVPYAAAEATGSPLPPPHAPLSRALRGELVHEARWRVHRPDGEQRVLIGSASPLKNPDGTSAGAVPASSMP